MTEENRRQVLTETDTRLGSSTLLTRLAQFAHSICWQNIPPEVRHAAKFNVLDTIGCFVSGADLPETKRLLRAEVDRGGPAEATVVGAGIKLPVEAATRINAYMGDIFELNDLIAGHASIATVTPALALAQARGANGAQLLEAVVTGIEIVCRIHGGFYAHQKPFTETGMVQVTIASAAGAAAAAAKLMGLDERQTLHAMAIAGALTSWGPAELAFGDGNTLKPILFGGCPGSAGLMGANYAVHGLTGSTRLLESPIGYYATVAREFDASVILDFDNWRLAQPRRKLHACCGYTHSAIDAVARLRRENLLTDDHRLRVFMPAYTIPAVSKKGQPPATGNEARFNIEYLLAHAMVDTDVILPEHSNNCTRHMERPEIADALARVETQVEADFGHYRFCRIEVLDRSGGVIHRVENDAPRGTEWNPMTDGEVRGKFCRLTDSYLNGSAADDYLAKLDTLETASRCDWLLETFSNSPAVSG